MMLGLLLARAGIDVVVLEKHADFLRDFRGDTVHPSTMQVMEELGLLDAFLARPHDELETIGVEIGGEAVQVGDFRHLPTRCKFIALMPQWDFLDFLADEAKAHPGFHPLMPADATGLVRSGDRVTGVVADTPDGPLTIQATLVVGTDGRHSTLREAARLPVLEYGAPMDVLWLRPTRQADDPGTTWLAASAPDASSASR